MHSENHLPGLLRNAFKVFMGWDSVWCRGVGFGEEGVGQPITLSHPTQVEIELDFDNIQVLYIHSM